MPPTNAPPAISANVSTASRLSPSTQPPTKEIPFGTLIDRLVTADVVCVGETHDSVMDHHIQLMIIKGLYAQDENLGVGMEMFQRPFQKTLDRYISGAVTEDTFLEDSDYQKRWGYDWSLYRPIVDFCRRDRVALAGLICPTSCVRVSRKKATRTLTADEKKLVGNPQICGQRRTGNTTSTAWAVCTATGRWIIRKSACTR
jgi:uncharacterized iron-regulated protein